MSFYHASFILYEIRYQRHMFDEGHMCLRVMIHFKNKVSVDDENRIQQ